MGVAAATARLGLALFGLRWRVARGGRRHIAVGEPGSIINIGASYAWTGGPGFAHSAAAKAGVKNMIETLAVEWAPYGIRLNGLVPGLFPHADETEDIKGVRDMAGELGFPIVVKPRSSSGSRGFFIARDEEDTSELAEYVEPNFDEIREEIELFFSS